jgi:lysophospholipase L1-like esterase
MKILRTFPLALASCAACAGEAPHAYWNPAIAAFEAADHAHPPPQGGVLFIGSWSIEHWKFVAADFPEVKVINRGFGGSEIADSTWFADRIVAPYRPRAIVICAGDNDIYYGHTPQRVLHDFAAFVRRLRSFDPGAPVAFVAIRPSVAHRSLLPQIRQANVLVREYAATQKGGTCIDVFTPMLGEDGQPQQPRFGPDGLHMNRSGYALWIAQAVDGCTWALMPARLSP